MNEKTELQIEEERQAVTSMRLAKSNMELALRRNDTLEAALRSAIRDIEKFTDYVPKNVYLYNSAARCQEVMQKAAEDLRKILGPQT